MRRTRSALFSCLLVFVASCGDDVTVSEPATVASAPAAMELQRGDAVPASQPAIARKLVRNAELTIVVSDIDQSMRRLDTLVSQSGSFVAHSERSDSEERRTFRVSLRVPADKLDPTLATLRTLGKVRNESSTTDDITKAYADLETRLAVKEQSLARLRALLETKSTKLSDVLDLEREISRTLSEVEQMKGERRYYDQQVSMSVVNVTFSDREYSASGSFSAPIRRAIAEGRSTLGRSIAAVLYLSIFILPWLLIGIPIWRLVKRRKRG
jgi:hypothetical protein